MWTEPNHPSALAGLLWLAVRNCARKSAELRADVEKKHGMGAMLMTLPTAPVAPPKCWVCINIPRQMNLLQSWLFFQHQVKPTLFSWAFSQVTLIKDFILSLEWNIFGHPVFPEEPPGNRLALTLDLTHKLWVYKLIKINKESAPCCRYSIWAQQTWGKNEREEKKSRAHKKTLLNPERSAIRK